MIAGLATSGVAAVATSSTTAAQSATATVPSASAPEAPSSALRTQGTSRSTTDRPALTDATAAAAAAKKAAADKAKATAARAAKAKAAKEKAAKEKAAKAAAAKAAAPSMRVIDTEYTRVALNVRTKADADSRLITVLASGSKVSVTSTVRGAWQHISYRGNGGWVRKQYLVESKPKAAASAAGGGGISSAACPGGSAVESGLTPDAVRVHRAICARFPAVTAYGGVRADALPEHPSGRALDAMVSNLDLGWQIARWLQANARQLGVSQILFAQRIWTVQRNSEGWRTFADRGSPSGNHTDHVHVTVYGNSGG